MSTPTHLKSLEQLASFASSDPSRFNITGIYMDHQLPYAVATDGHRLMACRDWHRVSHAGQTVDADIFRDKSQCVPWEGVTYPDWKMVCPRGEAQHVADFQVPAWFKKLRKTDKAFCSFVLNGCGGAVVIGSVAHDSDVTTLVSFDAALLAPFAGEQIRMHFKRVGKTPDPIVITSPKVSLTNRDAAFSQDWFALVMPLRDCAKVITEIDRNTENLPDNVVKMAGAV